jgi:2,4-dienoyl-CoA reductase-like NADH-dependent reductase (Old Yellow Enzyme family)
LLEVIQAIQRTVGRDFPLIVKVTGHPCPHSPLRRIDFARAIPAPKCPPC